MLLTLITAAHEKAPLFLPNWAFPLIAALAFLFMALVTWSYRDVANRHSDKTGPVAHGDGDEHDGGGQH